jgi:hypothetical protein
MDLDTRQWVPIAATLITAGLMWKGLQEPRLRLGDEPVYSSIPTPGGTAPLPDPKELKRNPFLQPGQTDSSDLEVTGSPAKVLKLEGIVLSGSLRLAIVSGSPVRVGDVVGPYTVQSIDEGRVVLSKDGELTELRSGDGTGPSGGDLRLSAIMTAGPARKAIIDGKILAEGDSHMGFTLLSVRPEGVALTRDGRDLELKIHRDDRAAAQRSSS